MRAEAEREKSLLELLDLCRQNAEPEASGVTKIAKIMAVWLKRLTVARRPK